MVGASTARTPAMVVASPWRRGGKSRKTAENTAGMSDPPEKPWMTRQKIRLAKPVLAAHPAEASVKIRIAVMNSIRMPSNRVRKPVSGMAMISAMR